MVGGVADTQPFFVKVTFAVFGGWGSDPCSPPACGGPPRDASAAGQSVFRVWPIGARSPVRVCRFTELTFLTLRKSMVFTNYHHGYSPSKMSLLTPDRTTRSPTSRCLTFERLLWLCRPCRRRLQFIVLLERLRRVDAQSHPGLLLQLESELV